MTIVLSKHPTRVAPKGPVICVVMDGVGIGDGGEGDAVAAARTPVLDRLTGLSSATQLLAHGVSVGMPSDKDMGNSEVGHNVLGCGRVFDQGAKLVQNAIDDGSLFAGEVWNAAVSRVKSSGQPLHFLGLLSDGNVHSHIDHLVAMLRRAAADGVQRVRIHALLDGRDVEPRSALTYVDQLEQVLSELRDGGRDYRIASGGGRMYITMDRYEADWAMVERGWQTHVRGEGRQFDSARAAVETLYAETDDTDQTLAPFVIAEGGKPVGTIEDGSAVVLFNFRGDRAIEISRAFEDPSLDAFDRGTVPDALFAGMMQYDGDLQVPKRFLVEPPAIADTMGELLAGAGKRQLAISETQKFGHVTYFWNGNRSGRFDDKLETYLEVPSDVLPFEERPWMKAAEITDQLVNAVRGGDYDFVRVNYANGDMVGHTGDLESTKLAVEAVDLCLARLSRLAADTGGVLVVTADHGNADQMFDLKKGERVVRSSHSLNPVPFAVFDPRASGGVPLAGVHKPQLANVTGTCLELLGFRVPEGWAPGLLGD